MSVRTLGIFAQVDAGKTTLSEALLYTAGSLKRLGRVDHGNAQYCGYPKRQDRKSVV